ncbi:MAG: amino acid ABC transporter substrate-binding protein [Gammaproteobacteria bacterium]|nr:amino acid ABC transporter substrate-binding protein [Gammaproteobacteria bacterium]
MGIESVSRRARLWAVAFAALCGLLPLSMALAGFGVPPIRIGVSLGLTGTHAEVARLQQCAYQLWESQVNERGGILGHPVQMVIRDDQSQPQVAAQIYQEFIETAKLDFVFGPYTSPITAAVAPIADKNGYPMLAAGAAADDIWKHGYQNVFGMWVPAGRYTIGFLELLSAAGIERVAIVTVDDIFSVSVAEGAKRWAPAYDLHVVDYRVLPKKNPDMVAAAKAARDSRAQALLLGGLLDESIAMRRALKQIGWTPAAFYASVGPTLEKYRNTLGADANGTFSTSIWEPKENLRLPGSSEFLRAYLGRYHELPSYHAASAFAAGQILEQAIIKAGGTDRSAVRHALATMDAESIIGRYAVDRTGVQIKRFPLIVQWHDDQREIVWPPELETASPVIRK